MLVKQRVADAMAPGDHGSTFAGNPLVTAAAETVVDIISDPAFLEGVRARGERLRAKLGDALRGNPHVTEIRGMGLITGIQLDQVREGGWFQGSAILRLCMHAENVCSRLEPLQDWCALPSKQPGV